MQKAMISYLFLGLLMGAMAAVQSGVNARLRLSLSSPFQAALISFAVGTAALALLVVVLRPAWSAQALGDTPWWAWTGGALGAFCVSSAVVLAPRVGALVLAATAVTGQLLTGVVLDHFGLVAFAKQPATPSRIAGVLLLIAGVLLVVRR